MHLKTWLTGVIFGAVIAAGVGIAYAAVPDSSGVIHGCYNNTSYALRVLDTAKTAKCPTGQTVLNWNQNGAIVVARPRLASATKVPFSTVDVTSLLVTPSTWGQSSASLQQVYMDASVTYPATCSAPLHPGDGVTIEISIDGQEVGSAQFHYTAGATVAMFPSQRILGVLFEPGAQKSHTITATADYSDCSGAADAPTINKLAIDVVGIK